MKASLIFRTSVKITDYGYPIAIKLSHKQKRVHKTIAHSKLQHFDQGKLEPLKSHPDYDTVFPLVLRAKETIHQVNTGNYSFAQASYVLFDIEPSTNIAFYEAGLRLCDNSTNGQLYLTVLNAFNALYPNLLVSDITPAVAKNFMRRRLENFRPNGVHTYLRTLSTIFEKLDTDLPNPFKGVRPKLTKTRQKTLTNRDLKKIFYTCTIKHRFDGRNTNEQLNHYRYYFMLLFYLGGIDMVDLARLRYDEHVIDGRIVFTRHKGGTDALINNKIFAPAAEILAKFDCRPYLVPIYKYKNYRTFLGNFDRRFSMRLEDLELTTKPLTKSPRYTFINRAQQLLIDQRITEEIVGHVSQRTHSIYTDEFPLAVRDKAHKKIIEI